VKGEEVLNLQLFDKVLQNFPLINISQANASTLSSPEY